MIPLKRSHLVGLGGCVVEGTNDGNSGCRVLVNWGRKQASCCTSDRDPTEQDLSLHNVSYRSLYSLVQVSSIFSPIFKFCLLSCFVTHPIAKQGSI